MSLARAEELVMAHVPAWLEEWMGGVLRHSSWMHVLGYSRSINALESCGWW